MKMPEINMKLSIPADIKFQFTAEVEFGMPSKKCNNFGICRIHPVAQYKENCNCRQGKSLAVITIYNDDYIELDFLRYTISTSLYDKFFENGKFKIVET